MTNKTQLIIFMILGSLLFSACNNRAKPRHGYYNNSQENIWAEDTNIYNDINISDLDYNNSVSIETETVIMEDAFKMPRVEFDQSEYARLAKKGRGTVKGNIYITAVYGKKVFGADTRLYLNPVTSYSEQWYEESYLGGAKMEKADARLFNYLRFTASNADGGFSFYGVPTGDYYLIGTVSCGEECGYSTAKSIRIATYVSVRGSRVVKKDLTMSME
jgi:hypothetical protein